MRFSLPNSLLGLLCILLLSVAEAVPGANFRRIRQYVQQWREERAMQEAYRQLTGGSEDPLNTIIESTIVQPLDHFNRKNPLTFKQRFWIYEGYWRQTGGYWKQPGGPVFLYIEGNVPLSKTLFQSGHHAEMAKKYGALLVALEHRFYGESLNPDGLKDHNLWFLSSQQALSDLVTFHQFITQKYRLKPNHPWICFGGFYGGSLAAWFRLKFPHLVFAAVASSAPIRAQLDFMGYNQAVAASLLNPVVGGSKKCLEAVTEAFSVVDKLLRAGDLLRLAKDFRSCRPLEGPNDCIVLTRNLASIFANAVQHNGEGVPSLGVRHVCSIMTDHHKGSAYQRLIAVNDLVLHVMHVPCLVNSYQLAVQELQSTNISKSSGERQWFFQMCTEFGYFLTCEKGCPFSQHVNLEYQLELCRTVFNITPGGVQAAVTFTNEFYGADHPKASRVLFVNGDIDPWHVLSVLKNQTDSEVAIVINGSANCADELPPNPKDPSPLLVARRQIDSQVGSWLHLARDMQGEN